MKKLIPLLLLILWASSYSFAQLPTSGLVAWYPFCGNPNDYSGNGYNLHDSGAVLTTDRFGNANCAYHFNGINNEMDLNTILPTPADFTYSCWMLTDTIQDGVVVYNGNSNSNGVGIVYDAGAAVFGYNITMLAGGVCFCMSVYATPHQWHHAVLRDSSGHYNLFIDTVLVATSTSIANLPIGIFAVGMDYTNGTNPFTGKIDDIAIYNRSLSHKEINQLYHFNPSVISFTSGNDTTVCTGATVTLNGVASGGAWSSTNPPVATVSGSGVITSVSAGTSIISYSTGVGCLGTETVNVTPLPSVISGPANVCIGSTITLSDTASGGTWSSGSTGIATVTPGSGIVYGVSAGIAIITYATGAGCFVTASITVYTAPSAITGATNACSGSTITLSDSPPGGTWSSDNTATATITPGPVGGGLVTGVAAGTAVITYALSGSCLATVTVTVNPPPSAISGLTNVCAGSAVTLSDAVTGGTWSSGSPGVATVTAGSGIVSGVSAGTANISYTSGAGCFVTASVTVNPSPAAITGNTNVCAGSTAILSDSPTGGTWSSGNTAAATIAPGPAGGGLATGIAPGSSVITYIAASGCFRTTTVTIYQPPLAISGVTNVCAGSTIVLSDSPSGGTWSSGSPAIATVTPSSGIVTGAGAGTAAITYTVAGNCMATATVTVNTSPSAITGATAVCAGSAITLSDSPAGGTWSSSNTNVATITPGPATGGSVTGITAGNTIITYSLAGGCSKAATVTVNAMPSAITGVMHACTGITTTLSDALSGGLWTSGSTGVAIVGSVTGIVTGISAGPAIISYSSNGCSVTATVTVNVEPSVISGSPNICTDGTTTLTATPGAGIWSLSNTAVATITPVNADSAIISGITTGTTLVTYSLSGCTFMTTITAVSFLPPISGAALVCTGRSVTLSNAVIGGTWTSTNTTVATVVAATGVVTGVAAGIPVISYSIGGSCITSATITVNTSPYPGVISGLSNVCVGATISLSDTVSGGLWGVTNSSAAVSAGLVTGISPGTDTVTYIVSTAFCSDTAIRPITVYPIPIAGSITGDTIVCVGASVTLSDPSAGGVWSSVFPAIATVTPFGRVTGLSAGIDTIKYTVSNPGCSAIASHIVTVYALPAIGAISGRAIVCDGSAITLSDASSGGVWSSGNTTIATINSNTGHVYAFSTGAAVITYTIGPNAAGCRSLATFTVTAHAIFTTDSIVSQIKCFGENNGSISVTITGGAPSYSWSNGNTASSVTGLAPGQYTLSVIDPATQCAAVDTFYISEPGSLFVSAATTNDLCNRGIGSINTTVTGGVPGYQYLWPGNSRGTGLQNLHAGTYTLTVTDNNNCTKTISVEVLQDTCSEIIVHNAITPNGDGVNDKWVIEGIQDYPTNTVQVFDKWGDMVYEKTGYNNDWEGKGKSGLLPDGTYYYLIKLNAQNGAGTQNTWTGSLLIKR